MIPNTVNVVNTYTVCYNQTKVLHGVVSHLKAKTLRSVSTWRWWKCSGRLNDKTLGDLVVKILRVMLNNNTVKQADKMSIKWW